MKIAVTGGSGFIGTRLITELKKDGHEIVIIDLVHEQPHDIRHLEDLKKACAGCDAIYHLAAVHRDDVFPRSLYYETNGQGTLNVIEAAKANSIKCIIFTSSVAVYAMDSNNANEDSEVAPFNDYGKSKKEAEDHLLRWAKESEESKLSIIRPVVVFGENNRGNVYNLIQQIVSGKFMMIGSGNNKKSMAYVGNIVDFLKMQLTAQEHISLYNYSDKPDLTTKELTDSIYKALNKNKPQIYIPYAVGVLAGIMFDGVARLTKRTFPISLIRIQKFCANTTVNADKAHSNGFKVHYSIQEGVNNMIQHDFKEHIQKI